MSEFGEEMGGMLDDDFGGTGDIENKLRGE